MEWFHWRWQLIFMFMLTGKHETHLFRCFKLLRPFDSWFLKLQCISYVLTPDGSTSLMNLFTFSSTVIPSSTSSFLFLQRCEGRRRKGCICAALRRFPFYQSISKTSVQRDRLRTQRQNAEAGHACSPNICTHSLYQLAEEDQFSFTG